ncbi:MAG: M20/M25/M40 family metallo-hydrolase [Acidimicrobiales bacterium]
MPGADKSEGPDSAALLRAADELWETDVLPTLFDYVRIPNLSPHFSPSWEKEGHMDSAVELLVEWCRARPIPGMNIEVIRPPGLTPTILIDVPGFGEGADLQQERSLDDPGVLLYGHLDKQPEFTGWREGLGPWEPVREGDKVYGRGVADDGYSTFCALTAIELLRNAGGSHRPCKILIEASEESGSPDLAAALDIVGERLGTPSVVIALDSGCPTYDRLWITNSLRGLVGGTLKVEVLHEGFHSGGAGGVVPSSFRIARMLLSRVEDEQTGEILLDELRVPVAKEVLDAARKLANTVGDDSVGPYPTVDGLKLAGADNAERIVRKTWEPSLSVTGAEGLPQLSAAGNVLRPYTALALSFRLPPTCDSEKAAEVITRALTSDPPYGAKVTFEGVGTADGWAAPKLLPWLADTVDEASNACFGKPSGTLGEGGSIPFMWMLSGRFPATQFLATGVLGPGSNAHGPNEFLDVAMAKKLTAAVGLILDGECRHEIANP